MPGNSGLDLARIYYQLLPPHEQNLLVRRIVRQAQIDRANAIRSALGRLLGLVGTAALDVGARFVRLYRAYAARRQYRLAMAEMTALSDRELKDIGVRRSEIYWVVHHGRAIPEGLPPATVSPAISADPARVTSVGARQPKRPVQTGRREAA